MPCRFKEYSAPVARGANQTDTRKARKAELQSETDFTPLLIALAVAAVGIAGLFFFLNNVYAE